MKITNVTLTLFKWNDIPVATYAAQSGKFGGEALLGLLTLETDQGVSGHSFLGSSWDPADIDCHSLIKFLKPIVIGQNPLDRERLNQLMWKRVRSTTVRTIGAVDVALWDIAGKVANLPIHRLLGSYRETVPAYASSQVLSSPQAFADEAASFRERNWKAYKIHPPQNWREDIKVCTAVREAVGDEYILMLDSTWSYDYPTAVRVGRALEDLGYYWFEDPLADGDIYNYVKLRQQLHIPLMATEYPQAGLDSYIPWLTSQATDFLRGDVAVKGGLTTLVKAAHMADAFHMNFEVHHGGNAVNNFAGLHLTMAIKNCEFYEVLLPDEAQKYGLLEYIEVDGQGLVHAPDKPGLGIEIDFDLIRRNTETVLD